MIKPKKQKKTTKKGKKRVRVDAKRWPGVYHYELDTRFQGKPDVAYTITFKDPVSGRKIWEKIGLKSQGITPQLCAELRSERMRKARHGEEVKTSVDIRRDALEHDKTLGVIADAYFEAKENELKGFKTDKNRWETHLKPLFSKKRVSELSPVDIQRVKSNMKDKAPATIWNTLELLRRLCNWGTRRHMCPGLSFTIKMPKKDNETVEFLTPEQAGTLDVVLNDWTRKDVVRMIKVAMFTGMRRGEIFKLKDSDIDFRHRLIRIRGPKGGKSAQIPLSDAVKTIFRDQIKWRDRVYPESSYIFPGTKGTQRVDCSAAKRIKAKAGLPKEFRIFHGMRHHFAVTLANSGQVDLSMIGELLTHKSMAMTKRYAAYLPETTRSASNLASKLIQKNIKPVKVKKAVKNEK